MKEIIVIILFSLAINSFGQENNTVSWANDSIIVDSLNFKRVKKGIGIIKLNKNKKGAKIKYYDDVDVDYIGFLTDNSQFDNSFKRGNALKFTLKENIFIDGFEKGLLKFREGESGYLYITPEKGYGVKGANGIPPNSILIYFIKVNKVTKPS